MSTDAPHATTTRFDRFATKPRIARKPEFAFSLFLGLIPGIMMNVPLHAANRVVVLRNGNTFTGNVERQQNRVVVRQSNTQMAFDNLEVDFVAKDLQQAYFRLSRRVPEHNLAAQEKLFLWCLKNDLNELAQQQLEQLKREHPESSRIKRWENRLQANSRFAGRTVMPAQAPLHSDTQRGRDASKSLQKSAMSQFVRRIQPILINRCAQADCHGRLAPNQYQLLRSSSPVPRATTERNLGATLRQLGPGPADQSLLWISAIESHPQQRAKTPQNARKAKVSVPLEPSELHELQLWLRQVYADLSDDQEQLGPNQQSPPPSQGDPFDPADFNSQEDRRKDAVLAN